MVDSTLIDEKKQKIFNFINHESYIPMKIAEIASFMEVPDKDKAMFFQIINQLIDDGKVFLTKKNKVISSLKLNMFVGTYLSNSRGFGFVTFEEKIKEDVFIHKNFNNGAMHKDKVLCRILTHHKGNKKEGEIIKVLKRGFNVIVGTFQQSKNFGFVVPDEKNFSEDIFISKNNINAAVEGNKVVVKIIKPAYNNKSPEGKIVEILGHINDPGVDVLSILKQFELETDFNEDVYNEVKKINDNIDLKEIEKRKDFRNIKMVTIDGEDAKDLDDAISLEMLKNGNFKLGVHIADVTHYVKENSFLDKEALKKGK